jgi:hypothetical protein
VHTFTLRGLLTWFSRLRTPEGKGSFGFHSYLEASMTQGVVSLYGICQLGRGLAVLLHPFYLVVRDDEGQAILKTFFFFQVTENARRRF